MKCSQCSSQALYMSGSHEISLCLNCHGKLADIQFKQALMHAAMMNQALDDMDAAFGLGPITGRIPVAEIAKAASQARTYNNINISNSSVGVINTGNLARIDAAITLADGTPAEEFGARLRDLTQTVLGQTNISGEIKQKLIDIAKVISDEVVVQKRLSDVVVTAMFSKLKELATSFTSVAAAVERLYEAWTYLKETF